MRRLTIGSFLVAALLALVIGSYGLLAGGNSSEAATGVLEPADPDANGPGLIYQIALDGVTTGNTLGPPKTGLTQGPIDSCISVGSGATFTFDLIIDEISPLGADPDMSGGQVDIAVPTGFTVSSTTLPGGVIDFTTPTPPIPGGSSFTAAWADFGTAWSGEVLFQRFTATAPGAGSGSFTLSLPIIVPGDGTDVINDSDLDGFTDWVVPPSPANPPAAPAPTLLLGLDVFVGTPCPTASDLKMTSQAVNHDGAVDVSISENVDLDLVVHNNGPDTPLNAIITSTVTAPAGCSATPSVVTTPVTGLATSVSSGTIDADFDIHCSQPSFHTFSVTSCIARDPLFTDSVPGNNCETDAFSVVSTAVSDIDVSQTVTPATSQFIVNNGVDDDGDTLVDEDPTELGIPGINNDGDGATNEDGGMVVPITISKTVSNAGPYGPTTVTDTLVAAQGNANAASCGLSTSPVGPFTPTVGTGTQTAVPAAGSSPLSYTLWMHCTARQGYGVDDDGDAIHVNIADTVADAFIDEDPPNGLDDDGDTLVDEDGPVALPAIVAENCADAKDPHITDPTPEPGPLSMTIHDGCDFDGPIVLTGALPFSPTGTITIDDAAASSFTAPADNDCLVTLPCKMQSRYSLPSGAAPPGYGTPSQSFAPGHHTAGTANDQGGQPLSGVSVIEGAIPASAPNAFSITHGNTLFDGAATAEISAASTVRLLPSTPCATPISLVFQLKDGDLVDTIDSTPGDDTPNVPGLGPEDAALASPFTWPTHLDSMVSFIDASNPPAGDGFPALWQRNVGFVVIPPATVVPINELVFDFAAAGPGTGPWLRFNHIGDPDFDADGLYDAALDGDDDGDGIPDAMDPDRDNDGLENSAELAQCTPLGVTLISLGETVASSYDTNSDTVPDLTVPGGQTYRVCNVINPINPPGSIGHTDAQRFTRQDIGTTTTVPSQVGCSGENDIIASICKDETPGDSVPPAGPCAGGTTPGVDNDGDTQIDEDTNLNGTDEDGDEIDGEDPAVDIVKANEPQGITVEFDVENGTVPGDVHVQLTIVGPAACAPQWVGQTGDTVNNWTGGPYAYSTIDRDELAMGANEVRYLTRKYMVTCPAGAHNFNIYNNVSSLSGLPDPNTNNNQAENQLQIIATDDVDGDGVGQPQDNCNWTPNPSQADLDGDGIGDACDIDDDDDGIPDGSDDCPTIPEDLDGVDDTDGCPDTDVSVDVDKEETYEVDVSQSVNKTVTITVTNGNYPANIQTSMVAVSQLTGCQVRLIPQAGDAYIEFQTDENPPAGNDTLWSQIERTDFFNAGETKVFTRQYSIHCFSRSSHSFELAVDAIPLPPVQEEDLTDNVHKNFPSVTAYDRADLKKVSLAFNNPPASVKVGQSFNLNIVGTIHNNGPTTGVVYDDTLTVNLPSDCTATGPTVFNFTGTMITSVATPINATVTDVVCTEQSNHNFSANNVLTVTTMHVRDHVSGNNNLSANANVAVIADADVKVSSVTVNAPANANVNTNFNVSVTATLHNNGPESPVNVDGSVDLSVPADCTKNPAGAQAISNLSLPASTATPVTKTWTVNCSQHSNHTFNGSASVTVDQIHVDDPDTGNNSGNGSANTAVFKLMEKTICDVYVGPAPVPSAPTGPASACPAVDPWNGGPGVVAVSGATVQVVSDDLDYSSELVTIERTTSLTGIAGGPQVCTVSPASPQVFTETEPQGLSTAGTVAQWDITLPLPTHDGEPNWCVMEYTVTKEIKDLHVADTIPGDLTQTVTFIVARDTDGDGVFDNAAGDLDNCKLVPNPGQEDSNGNGSGDACDNNPDVREKYITVLGPAAVNLTDNNGRYMWVIGEMGNNSNNPEEVTISISVTPPVPAGCTSSTQLVLPGQSTFLMLPGEQKFQVYRVRFECHAPATEQVITLTVTKCIDLNVSDSHDDDNDGFIDEDSRDGVDNDGDSEDGEDPPNPDGNPGNDCQTATKQLIIDQP